MRKSYILVFGDTTGTKDQLKEILNKMNTIITWRTDMPHSFYLVSANTAQEIYDDLIAVKGKEGRFLISEVSDNSQGLLPKDSWYFIQNKKLKPKDI